MRVPLPSVALQGDPAADVRATSVVPMQNPVPRQQADLWRSVQEAGSAVAGIADHLQGQIDAAETRKYDNVFADATRDAVNGLESLLGQNAVKAHAKAVEDLAKTHAALSESIDNVDVRAVFDRAASKRMQMARDAMQQHVLRQAHVYEVGESKARIDAAQMDAATAALKGDPAYTTFVDLMRKEVDAFAELHGLPAESAARKALQLAATSAVHDRVVRGFADTDAARAKQWLEANARDVDLDTGGALDRVVREGGIRDESIRLAAELQQNVIKPPPAPGPKAAVEVDGITLEVTTWADEIGKKARAQQPSPPTADLYAPTDAPVDVLTPALTALDERFNAGKVTAEVRDATRSRLIDDDRLRQDREAERTVAFVMQARQWVSENPGRAFADLPPELTQALKARHAYDGVREFARTKTALTDPNAWLEVLRLEESGEIRQLSGPRLFERFLGRLDDGDMQRAEAMRIRSINGVLDAKTTRDLSVHDIVNEGLRRTSLQQIKDPDERATRVYRVRKEIDRRLALLGREAKAEEVQQITDDVTLDVAYRDVTGADPLEPVSGMDPAEQETATILVGGEYIPFAKVPAKETQEIVSRLQALGQWPASARDQRRMIVETWVAGGRRGVTAR